MIIKKSKNRNKRRMCSPKKKKEKKENEDIKILELKIKIQEELKKREEEKKKQEEENIRKIIEESQKKEYDDQLKKLKEEKRLKDEEVINELMRKSEKNKQEKLKYISKNLQAEKKKEENYQGFLKNLSSDSTNYLNRLKGYKGEVKPSGTRYLMEYRNEGSKEIGEDCLGDKNCIYPNKCINSICTKSVPKKISNYQECESDYDCKSRFCDTEHRCMPTTANPEDKVKDFKGIFNKKEPSLFGKLFGW